ncbi:hypothetical protein C4552_03265 [Candidatus Parcubacteria bacterium]|nr:MAG: hypothetical protein C4552_03265 [Candidatus Parcubacteria bacterium]
MDIFLLAVAVFAPVIFYLIVLISTRRRVNAVGHDLILIPILSAVAMVVGMLLIPDIRDVLSCGSFTAEDISAFVRETTAKTYGGWILVALGTGTFLAALLYAWIMFFRRKDRMYLAIGIAFLGLALLSALMMSLLQTARASSPDARRISTLKQAQLALELYADDNDGMYPIVIDDTTANARWQALRANLTPHYIPDLPDDRCYATAPGRQYDYRSDAAGTAYVLRALLQDPNMIALSINELDGDVLDMWCGEPEKEIEYCLAP